jgi:hypothetical protein
MVNDWLRLVSNVKPNAHKHHRLMLILALRDSVATHCPLAFAQITSQTIAGDGVLGVSLSVFKRRILRSILDGERI